VLVLVVVAMISVLLGTDEYLNLHNIHLEMLLMEGMQ
jgi:hypothetical protein